MIAGPATSMTVAALVALALGGTPREELDRARNAFFRAEYQRAIEILRPLLYPEPRLDSEDDVVLAFRMLGVAYLFEQRPNEARREFRRLLELRPDYHFDPLLDPPRVVDFFNEVVKEQSTDLAQIEARRRKLASEAASRHPPNGGAAGATAVRYVERRSPFISYFPFGAGQFQNGQRRKAWFFLTSETALAATSVAAFVTNFALFGVRPVRPCKETVMPLPDGTPGVCPDDKLDHTGERLSRNIMRVQVATGAAFFAVAIWGVVDAVRNFRSDVPLDAPSAAPPPSSPASSGPARPPLASRLDILPALSPHGQGVLLSISF